MGGSEDPRMGHAVAGARAAAAWAASGRPEDPRMGAGAEAMAVEAQGNGSSGGSGTLRSLEPEGLLGTLADTAPTEATAQQAAAVVVGGSDIPSTLFEADNGETATPRARGEAEVARQESGQGGGGRWQRWRSWGKKWEWAGVAGQTGRTPAVLDAGAQF